MPYDTVPVRLKQPGEVKTLTFDFSSKAAAGETILSVDNVAVEGDGSLTSNSPNLTPPYVTVQISGGLVDGNYRVSVRVLTSFGNKYELDVIIQVREGEN